MSNADKTLFDFKSSLDIHNTKNKRETTLRNNHNNNQINARKHTEKKTYLLRICINFLGGVHTVDLREHFR